MDLRRIDPHEDTAARAWFATLRAGATAGREAPLFMGEAPTFASLRSNDDNPFTDRRAYAAWEGARCLGALLLALPRRDNTHLAEVEVLAVPPAERRRGIGGALLDLALAEGRRAARTVAVCEVSAPAGAALPDTPGGRFAASRGFTAKHAEDHLVLDVPVAEESLRVLEAAAAPRTAGYRTHTWTGTTPPEHLPALARLHGLMERDVPTGDLDRRPADHDAELVQAGERRLLEQGYRLLTTLSLGPGGEPAAYTVLIVHPLEGDGAQGAEVSQDNTFVARAHRGRRLSLRAKAANLRRLAAAHPEAARVHTYTAPGNDAMRTVNERVGFRHAETDHALEHRIAT